MPASARCLSAIAAIFTLAACSPPAPVAAPKEPEKKVDEPAPLALVDASVVLGNCPDSAKMDSRSANLAIQKLVEPCSTVPGGAARFSATLLPGGRIELASPSGNTTEGVVPMCMLHNHLTHRVMLRHPCEFNVVLEQRGVSMPASGAGTPPAP